MLFDVPGPVVVVLMSAAAFAEGAFGLGAFVPGETAVVTGALALRGHCLLAAAWPAVAAGAFLGDHVGYLLGRRLGPALAESAPVRRIGRDRWDRATGLVRRHGLWALVVARLLPGVRTLVGAAAGTAGVGYGRFALADGIAAALWSGVWVLGGALAGRALVSLASDALLPTLAGGAALAVAFAVVRRLRGRASRKEPPAPRR